MKDTPIPETIKSFTERFNLVP